MDLESIANEVVFSIKNDPEDKDTAIAKAVRWYNLDSEQKQELIRLVNEKLTQ